MMGSPDPDWELSTGTFALEQLKWGNIIRLTIAVILTVLPLPWVWLHPRGIAGGSA